MKTDFDAIKFDPEYHTYHLNGRRLANVTGLIGRLKKPFDAEYWANKKAQERGVTADVIRAEWDEARRVSLEKGTRLHKHIELALKDERPDDPFLALNGRIPEMDAFDRMWSDLEPMVHVRATEWVIGDAELGIAGTADAVLFNRGLNTFHVWDWKTGKKFETANRFQRLKPPFDDLDECELNVYSLQASLYRLMLERNTELVMSDCYVAYFGPDGRYMVHRALDLRERLLAWLEAGDGQD